MSQIVWDKKTLEIKNKIDELIKAKPSIKNISVGKIIFDRLIKRIYKDNANPNFNSLHYKDVEIKP